MLHTDTCHFYREHFWVMNWCFQVSVSFKTTILITTAVSVLFHLTLLSGYCIKKQLRQRNVPAGQDRPEESMEMLPPQDRGNSTNTLLSNAKLTLSRLHPVWFIRDTFIRDIVHILARLRDIQ